MYCYANFAVTQSPLWQHFKYLELALSDITSFPPTWLHDYQRSIKISTLTQQLPQKDDEPETFPFFIHQTRHRFCEILRCYLDHSVLQFLATAEIKDIKECFVSSTKKAYEVTIVFGTVTDEWEMIFYFGQKYVLRDLINLTTRKPKKISSTFRASPLQESMSYDELQLNLQQQLASSGRMLPIINKNTTLPTSPSPLFSPATSSISMDPPSAPISPSAVKIGGGAFKRIAR